MVSYTKGSLEQVWKRVGTEICGRWLDEPPVNQTLSKASQTKCFPNKRKKSLVSSLLTFSEEILLSFHTTARCCFYADLSFCKAPLCVVWLLEKHFSTTRVKSLNGTLRVETHTSHASRLLKASFCSFQVWCLRWQTSVPPSGEVVPDRLPLVTSTSKREIAWRDV